MKQVRKIDEDGNIWVMIPASKCETLIKNIKPTIERKIVGNPSNKRLMTATDIAIMSGLDSSRKPVIDAVAKAMRELGFGESRRGSGKYFVMFEKQKKSDHITDTDGL